nr:MAG TPA: hypothetical protein [Caudoviricetes sp.]
MQFGYIKTKTYICTVIEIKDTLPINYNQSKLSYMINIKCIACAHRLHFYILQQ